MTPPTLTENPFTLGVASGDPLPDSVVLWTRLAPRPHEVGNGLPAQGSGVPVQWELSADDTFRRVEQSGTVTAPAQDNHTVHLDLRGLEPDHVYWYRFHAGDWTSPVGRTRTAPDAAALPAEARFGLISCQQYDEGYYTALRHLADEDLDAVFFVGDYIYENAIDARAGARKLTTPLPAYYNHWLVSLDDYRQRYALGRTDPDLQAAHAAHPWYVTWDDHEVENNYAGDISQDNLPVDTFRARRAAAYRAYWENMPLRRAQRPDGPAMRLHRRFQYGQLAQFDILDTRQYRSDQAYGDGWKYPGPESENPARTLTGAEQERWLLDGFRSSSALWNVIPQQVCFARRKETTAARSKLSMDAWDGYPASRQRVLAGVEQAGIQNLVVLTGDDHVHYALDIKKDFDDPASRTLGVEFVGTSVSSGFDGEERPDDWSSMMAANPHMKYYDARRGYVVVSFGEERVRADFRTLTGVTRPGAPVSTAASFVSEAGDPGLRPA